MSVAPAAQPELRPALTPDRLRVLLAAAGYRSTMVSVHGWHLLPVGCSVVLQFGDGVMSENAAKRIPIKVSIVINGAEEHVGGITRWQIDKMVSVGAGADEFTLVLDADLLLGSAVSLDEWTVRGEEALSHLTSLIADLRETLSALPLSERRGEDARRLTARVEARYVGDIVAGRTGLVHVDDGDGRARGRPPRISTRSLHDFVTTCDGLAGEVLPELARVVRATFAASPPDQSPSLQAGEPQSWHRGTTIETIPETLQ